MRNSSPSRSITSTSQGPTIATFSANVNPRSSKSCRRSVAANSVSPFREISFRQYAPPPHRPTRQIEAQLQIHLSAEIVDRRAGPAELAEVRQRWKRVKVALRQLPEQERAAITLRDIEGLSTAEVTAFFGTTEGAVRSQIAAARMKLRRLV